MNTQITEFTKTEASLATLEGKYSVVPDATTSDGYAACVEAIRELRPLRTGLDKMRLSLNSDDQARIKFRNTEARRITNRLTALEDPIKAAKVAVDTEKERIEEEALQVEMKRISDITTKIENMGNLVNMLSPAAPAEQIEQRLVSIQSFVVNVEEYGEYLEAAHNEQSRVIGLLEAAYTERKEYEASQVEMKRLQAEQAAVAAKQAEEQAKLDADRKAIEAERAEASRVMREAQEAAEAEKRRIEQAKLDEVKRQREEKEIAEQEEKARIYRETMEAEEAARIEAMAPDKVKLLSFSKRLDEMKFPVLKSAEGKRILEAAAAHIRTASSEIKGQF